MQAYYVNGNSHSPLPPVYTLSEKTERILAQEINNLDPYTEDSPLLQGQHPYPVIFEPIKHIKLSRSTYKVVSFLDFTPHIRTFESFERYLDDLSKDINDTDRLGALEYVQQTLSQDFDKFEEKPQQEIIQKLINIEESCDMNIEEECRKLTEYMNTCYGLIKSVCDTKRKYRKLVSIMNYIREDFQKTKDHFFKAIDHVQERSYETPVQNKTNKEKRSIKQEELVQEAYEQIDYNDQKLAEEIFEKLGSIDLETGKKQTRHKRFGLMNWIMGWGVFSNLRNIKQIKKNIRTLYHQNLLQEKQIQDLAHYLNLTATHVQLQGKMINELQTKLAQLDFQLLNLHIRVNYHIHVNGFITGDEYSCT